MENTPANWNHPVLPGNFVQGSVLITASDCTEAPQSSALFFWKKMEEVFGVHDLRLRYDDEHNIYQIQKSEGHLLNDGTWEEKWTVVGSFTGLSAEAEQAIQNLVYVLYTYEATSTHLKVTGLKRDGTTDVLCNIVFASTSYVDSKITELKNNTAELVIEGTEGSETIEVLVKGE